WATASNSKWLSGVCFSCIPRIGFLIQGMGADSRSSSERPEGRLRGLSRQAEGRGCLFDGGHRFVGLFTVLHAVGVVPFLSALACARAQDLQLPYAVWHGENPDGQSHPFD